MSKIAYNPETGKIQIKNGKICTTCCSALDFGGFSDTCAGCTLEYTEWSDAQYYIVGSVVRYNWSVYECVLAHTASSSNHPPNGTYWKGTPKTPDYIYVTLSGWSDTEGFYSYRHPNNQYICNGIRVKGYGAAAVLNGLGRVRLPRTDSCTWSGLISLPVSTLISKFTQPQNCMYYCKFLEQYGLYYPGEFTNSFHASSVSIAVRLYLINPPNYQREISVSISFPNQGGGYGRGVGFYCPPPYSDPGGACFDLTVSDGSQAYVAANRSSFFCRGLGEIIGTPPGDYYCSQAGTELTDNNPGYFCWGGSARLQGG